MDEPDRVRTEGRNSDSPTVAQTHFRIGKDWGEGRDRCAEGEWEGLLSWKGEAAKARIIHGGSSAPHPSLPHNMGEGEGGGDETGARSREGGRHT